MGDAEFIGTILLFLLGIPFAVWVCVAFMNWREEKKDAENFDKFMKWYIKKLEEEDPLDAQWRKDIEEIRVNLQELDCDIAWAEEMALNDRRKN